MNPKDCLGHRRFWAGRISHWACQSRGFGDIVGSAEEMLVDAAVGARSQPFPLSRWFGSESACANGGSSGLIASAVRRGRSARRSRGGSDATARAGSKPHSRRPGCSEGRRADHATRCEPRRGQAPQFGARLRWPNVVGATR